MKIKQMPDDECGIPVDEEDGLIVERLPNGKLAIYRKDLSKFKKLNRE